MENETVNSDVIDNINNSDILAEGISPQADYYYDYRGYLQTIINNQNEQKANLSNLHSLVNVGFTSLVCLISISFIYCYVKNLIRK